MALQSIKYERGSLLVLDQLLLPAHKEYIDVKHTRDGWEIIKKMQVRGAPAIAIAGCLSLAVELTNKEFETLPELASFIKDQLQYLVTSRPTAVNMLNATKTLSASVDELVATNTLTVDIVKERIIEEIECMMYQDISVNKSMGWFGAEHILERFHDQSVNILTHCNAGALATAGYGTALGIIRTLHERNRIKRVYFTETRPYNQGSRLTAYELVHDNIPATLICDSHAAILMKLHDISAVVVGADRVVANGDTANKVGTYQLSIVARHHEVPFYVSCPSSTFDPTMETGEEIVIEERPHIEMTETKGIRIAAPGINCWNPAFDVTPAELITGGIVTEFGVFKPGELKEQLARFTI
ncbi:methylthioribose-1-phosphate isomerase-like [Gigantopelta aegis]|uniref:methylthioribose-1-phosphate isomerase-like n=1 Tax=Gigantopelta aegis TaxID=1735272 RepID=UPI001B889884|nr:methylthioribose-1-phosphate isomerase-like [Gigantopelta aegis]